MVSVVPTLVVEDGDVARVEGGGDVVVIEVAGAEVSAEVVKSVVAMVTVLEGDVGVVVAWVVECVVISVDTGVVLGVRVDTGVVVETGGEVGGTVVVVVKVLALTAVEVVDVGELTVLVGVTEDVVGGVEVACVVADSVETSLVGAGVVFQVDGA